MWLQLRASGMPAPTGERASRESGPRETPSLPVRCPTAPRSPGPLWRPQWLQEPSGLACTAPGAMHACLKTLRLRSELAPSLTCRQTRLSCVCEERHTGVGHPGEALASCFHTASAVAARHARHRDLHICLPVRLCPQTCSVRPGHQHSCICQCRRVVGCLSRQSPSPCVQR